MMGRRHEQNTNATPQAWAKNIDGFPINGDLHLNNLDSNS